MEIFIAILWYLGILFSNTPYTVQEVDTLIIDKQDAINEVQNDNNLMDDVITTFYNETTLIQEGNVIQVWEEEDGETILD